MFGLESVGPGRDVRVEGAGVPEFETPLGAPAAELAARAWRGQVDEPREDKLAELRTWVDGLPAKLRDSFLGEAVAGFEEVSNGIRDGLVQGFADAIRDVEDLGERLIPVRDAARALIRPVEDRVAQVEESQLSTEEQLALLDGVRGFAYAVQAANVNTRNGDNGVIQLPLTQWGVSKGAYVTREGIVIQEPGVWQINSFVSGRQTIATPGFGQQDTTVFTFGGVPGMTPPRVIGEGGPGSVTINTTFVVRISSPTVIKFWAGSARWRYFEGGHQYSNFSVIKHDSRLGEAPPGTVPDV